MSMSYENRFTAYDVYRVDCTRYGFMMTANQNAESTSSPHKLSMYGDEMYLEFGPQVLIEKGLPEGITSFDGLGVEIQLHVFTSLPSGYTNYYENHYLSVGVCDEKIAENAKICWANRPSPNYFIDGYQNWLNRFVGIQSLYGDSAITGDKSGVEEIILSSTSANSPVDVLNALKNAAITIRSMYDLDSGGYNGNSSVNIYAGGSYSPYVEILYGIVSPDKGMLAYSTPSDGAYINPKSPEKINVKYRCADRVTVYPIDKTITSKSIIGGSTPHGEVTVDFCNVLRENVSTVTASSLNVEIPEEVLALDKFIWRPTVSNVFGASVTASMWKEATTVDAIPETIADSPKNTYVNVDEAAFFDWTHIIATGTPQSKYELQGLMGGVWTTLQEEESSETSAVVPADKLSSGITAWRVRTANNDGVFGEYSEPAQVIFIVAPKVTGVTVSGNVRPTIAWQSADQQGYEIMIDGVTTGVQYGTEKSLVWNDLLADGAHVVQVRVVNRFGLFSQWAEATHEVSNVPQEVAPVMTAALVGKADVQLMWAGEGTAETLVYRDGELIGRAQSAGVYVDHTAYDEHLYRVRVVAADSNYTDSNEVRIAVPLRETMLAALGEWNWIELAYSATAEPPVRTAELAPLYALNYYSGREKPVAEMSRHKSATYSVTYAVTKQQAAQLRGMMGKIVVHKRKGELIRGLLQSVSEARTWWGVDLTLQIVEVDEG